MSNVFVIALALADDVSKVSFTLSYTSVDVERDVSQSGEVTL